MSACNPVCGAGETCSGAICLTTEPPREAASGRVNGTAADSAREDDQTVRFAARAGLIYQYWKISSKALGGGAPSNAGVTGVAGGVEVAVDRWHLVISPRFAAVFGEDSQMELGVDVGVRLAKQLKAGRLGVDVLFTPMLFLGVAPDSQGFYYGGRADVFFERGRVRALAGFGYGHIATFTPDATVNWYELGVAVGL